MLKDRRYFIICFYTCRVCSIQVHIYDLCAESQNIIGMLVGKVTLKATESEHLYLFSNKSHHKAYIS